MRTWWRRLVLASLVRSPPFSAIASAQDANRPAVEPAVAAPPNANILTPSDPAAKAAFNVLEKHCSRCHQDGRLSKRLKPAKNFGFVLRLDELAKTPQLVLPGNPDGSKLFNRVVNKEMPYVNRA